MGSPAFFVICNLHSMVAIACGGLMMFYLAEISSIKFQGSTPHDQLLIRTSDSFSGLLLVAIGLLLLMVSFVRNRDFQSFFAKEIINSRYGLLFIRLKCGQASSGSTALGRHSLIEVSYQAG
ncbi:hypothetical protein CDL15_Pgr007449 [Punica granatum]|uniref:DUF7865 domain-containing protein n=1 Tax=Punica granatum TaxID=22663 RepID=A0A218XA73_PUNGR|nr:hypothetical protein CDL15_Pgr007449 [Punica granatum]